jgi:hypothetical protein
VDRDPREMGRFSWGEKVDWLVVRQGSRPVIPDEPFIVVTMLNFSLVGLQECRVRDLAGFQKSHRVPEEDSQRSRAFVRRIAATDIGLDLDQRYADFRRELGLKRAQLEVSEPHDGCGTIATPAFSYQVSVDLRSEDPSTLFWKRRVFGFNAPEPLLSDSFSATFGTTFDTVEFEPLDPVDVEAFIDWIENQSDGKLEPDYDRMATWCRLTARDQTASTMLVQSHVISLTSLQPVPPVSLLQSFFSFRDMLPEIQWHG